jgi:hypothetical protein
MIQRGVGKIRVVSGKKLNAQYHSFTSSHFTALWEITTLLPISTSQL